MTDKDRIEIELVNGMTLNITLDPTSALLLHHLEEHPIKEVRVLRAVETVCRWDRRKPLGRMT